MLCKIKCGNFILQNEAKNIKKYVINNYRYCEACDSLFGCSQ